MKHHPPRGTGPVRPAPSQNPPGNPVAARQSARRLITELVASPRGPARQMVELYLVAHLANLEIRREEQALAEAQDRDQEFESLRAEAEKLMADGLNLEERNRWLSDQVAAAEFRRDKLVHHLQALEAQKNKGLTAEQVYRKIFEAVGLVDPRGARDESAVDHSQEGPS
ncbi:MAG TPA: hypothetical protein VI455_05585 [Terriglobia bacterium]